MGLKKMIISELCGGLGNQMFQYAFSRAMSLKYGKKLKITYTTLPGQSIHNGFELSKVFSLDVDIATFNDIRKVLDLFHTSSVFRKIVSNRQYCFFRHKFFVTEQELYRFSDEVFSNSDLFLSGYWQSENFFLDFQDVIRKDFSFSDCNDDRTLGYLNKIKRGLSLSIHVRRGDYISNIKAASVHGVCSIDYYKKAFSIISKKFPEINVFMFSDDLDWVESTYRSIIPNMTIVENIGSSSFKDMYLMSNCHHHIIANSSFSWWGAWLNPSRDKSVIAPKNWFVSPDKNIKDLLPDYWIKI